MARRLLTVATVLVGSAAQTHATEVIRVLTNIAPPYQEMVGGNLDGTSTRAFNCVMDRMNHRYQVALAPWLRAREQVRMGLADGVFSIAPDIDGDSPEGKFSLPLALERWVWVTSVGGGTLPVEVRPGLPVAAVLGSNQLKFLAAQEAITDGSARSATQLLRMLAGGRVAAVLMDEAELRFAWKEANINPAYLKVTFQRYMPLGVYFSKTFLAAHPGFLERFNAKVPHCAAANMSLTAGERRIAIEAAQQVRDQVLASPLLISSLQASWAIDGAKSVQQIMDEDHRFQKNRANPNEPLVSSVVDHPLSDAFTRIRRESGGAVSEILLFNAAGVAVASSPLSTDLWQADERKFSMTVPNGPDTVFVDNIAFDQSTSQFSVQISFTIPGTKPGTVIGGLTVGLNIEKTLTGS
ncbi:hypothetical protein CHU95_15305 [Niveispirillum lacus]|uniref:Solute-binding protein family 3/N-terminal domain-containing protein n=2 Tax=Niveispirillum lacus TaxID=1981099 RepID=A0A255YYH2_9PROT|nr:hypothetical protein CHU95_15305 [Niveispirillum lacus]